MEREITKNGGLCLSATQRTWDATTSRVWRVPSRVPRIIKLPSAPSTRSFIRSFLWPFSMSSESSYGFGQVPDLEKNGQGGFVRPEDPVAFVEAREQRVRDRFVNLHQAKLLREELRQCYYKSGVNHYQDCKSLVERYMQKINAPNFGMSE